MAKGEILYIEDNFHNRRIVRKILERQDYVLYDAEDGLEGYNRLKELMPKVVLLDISLPTMDGIEIANRVKADQETRDVILIALTASAMAGDRERFLEAGCDDYLSKPFRALDLVEMVDYYMSPDFVPGKSLSPGAKMMVTKEDISKPIAASASLPKPDLERKTKPKSEVMKKTAASPKAEKPAEPKAEKVVEPKAEKAAKPKAKKAVKPKAAKPEKPKAEKKASSNGVDSAKSKAAKPQKKSKTDKTAPKDASKLDSGISGLFDSLDLADPNKDQD